MSILLGTAVLFLTSCSAQPVKSDFYGSYKLIKIRENGKILNIDTLVRIELSEELYTTAMDRNGDYVLSANESESVSYSFHLDKDRKPYLQINNDQTAVYLWDETHFDLLLKRVDPFGNETMMYFKRLSEE